jgi:uncharacterized protein (DUF433 family)
MGTSMSAGHPMMESVISRLDRITSDRASFGAKPIVRGMRISVELILSPLAPGETNAAILDDYPDLQSEDIIACLAYAAVLANGPLNDVAVARR